MYAVEITPEPVPERDRVFAFISQEKADHLASNWTNADVNKHLGCFVNHHPSAHVRNCRLVVCDEGEVHLQATRRIMPGDALYCDYGSGWFRSTCPCYYHLSLCVCVL